MGLSFPEARGAAVKIAGNRDVGTGQVGGYGDLRDVEKVMKLFDVQP